MIHMGKLFAYTRSIGFALCSLLALSSSAAWAQLAPNRYALILEDAPVASKFSSQEKMQSLEAMSYRHGIELRQRAVRSELESRNIPVVASVSTVLNAIFVLAPKDRVPELQSLPGVLGVVQERLHQPALNRATTLLNAPAAWTNLGGVTNAGKGIKIAILDSGIDQTHAAFQDPSLSMPAGYPICNGDDCNYTSNKVIVARSYVRLLAAGSDPSNPAADSRPDDYSARDRSGHGTATASCAAGVSNTGPSGVTFNGIAPKAYLGNYKIYGSPGVNDQVGDAPIVAALEDAINDGMDIISFSSGGPAISGPLDTGSICGNAAGVPCDLSGQAFENAAKAGAVIVAAAGNDGETGDAYPTFNDISSPADAPSVIAVGATTNSHYFLATVSVLGGPSNLQKLVTQIGDSNLPIGALTLPLVDVTQLGNDGNACTSLPGNAPLAGAIALVNSANCTLATKAQNVYNAYGVAMIVYNQGTFTELSSASIPGVGITNSDGLNLKSFIDSNPGHTVTLDPNTTEETSQYSNLLAVYSSFGPSIVNGGLKPDLVAVGGAGYNTPLTGVYMAAQSYDPLGDVYSSNGYVFAQGTSFATPLVAGAAALVKQNHPNFTGAQIRSALIDTASQTVASDEAGDPVGVQWLGAGQLNVGAAVAATVTCNPPTISFGLATTAAVNLSQQLQLTNSGSSTVNLSNISATGQPGMSFHFDKSSLSLAANSSGTLTVTVTGSLNTAGAGAYGGYITLSGSGLTLHVPYLFMAGSASLGNFIALLGDQNDGTVGQPVPDGELAFKITDPNGVPLSSVPVTWSAGRNSGTITSADAATNNYGIATAQVVLGATPGTYSFSATVEGYQRAFTGTVRAVPTISANGVVNGASFSTTQPIAPGSYITIFGTGLSDIIDYATTSILPLAIDFANVSFDVPSAGISVPGHLIYVNPTQVNLQVPWELQGQSSVQVKVTIDQSYGNVVAVPLSNYSPAFFEIGTGVVAALDGNYQVVGASNPVSRGQVVQLYANGLGPVTNQPASGSPASASPLSTTTTTPTVSVGGQPANVIFSGLAPGFPGLYQVNAIVPSNIGTGSQPITVSIGGQTSKASGLQVQ